MPERHRSSDQPAWIYKRNGRLVPFEPDKICRSLFAAAEATGCPDPFMARELTDGVLHFLSGEMDGGIPTTSQLGDMVAKIVRELGQPSLAQAFEQFHRRTDPRTDQESEPLSRRTLYCGSTPLGPPRSHLTSWARSAYDPQALIRKAGKACLGQYAVAQVYSRDLLAAQEEGWITLVAPEASFELESVILQSARLAGPDLGAEILSARSVAGRVLVIDGPEHALGGNGYGGANLVARFISDLRLGLAASGLAAILNLNRPEANTDDASRPGPLYANAEEAETRMHGLSSALLDEATSRNDGSLRIAWHVREEDLSAVDKRGIENPLRRVRPGIPLTFVFDRPRQPRSLAEGLDADHPAVLLTVAMHLPRLAHASGPSRGPDVFLERLASLARLAISAARQKREFLRRSSPRKDLLARGFLVDRARLVVIPMGLEAVVRELCGTGMCRHPRALELGVRILDRLRQVLQGEAKSLNLEACVDSAADFGPRSDDATIGEALETDPREVAGVTAWDPDAPPNAQIRASSALHATVGSGTAAVLLRGPDAPALDGFLDLLRSAAEGKRIQRLRFVLPGHPRQQLLGPWEA